MNNLIKDYRKAYGWTQTDLGKRLGVTAANISSWEVGRTEPTVAQSIEMANMFGCTVAELFDVKGHAEMDKRLLIYATKLSKLPEDRRATIEQLIDNLSEITYHQIGDAEKLANSYHVEFEVVEDKKSEEAKRKDITHKNAEKWKKMLHEN